MKSISFITAHFHDFGWTQRLVERVVRHTPQQAIAEFLVIDQDRTPTSRARLARLDPRVRVVQYPKSPTHFTAAGHDHAWVLNAAVREAKGETLCVLDSDAHPVTDSWVDTCSTVLKSCDAIVAECTYMPGFSHPCFMVLQRDHAELGLAFDAELFENGMDTGRLIAAQLRAAGQHVHLAPITRRTFDGHWGVTYLESIYHHNNGSFGGGDTRLTSQLTWRHSYFRDLVLKSNRYTWTPYLKITYLLRLKALGLRNRLNMATSRWKHDRSAV